MIHPTIWQLIIIGFMTIEMLIAARLYDEKIVGGRTSFFIQALGTAFICFVLHQGGFW